MIKYICKRLAMGIVTLFFLVTITFFLTRLMPGSPFETDNISPAMLASLEEHYGLDKPVEEQYVLYLKELLHGSLGISYKKSNVNVNDLIRDGFPITLQLGLISFGIAIVVGIVIGVWMSVTKSEAVKGWILTASTVFISIPGFVLAIDGESKGNREETGHVPARIEKRAAAVYHSLRTDAGISDHGQLRGGEYIYDTRHRQGVRELGQ